jgi:hypothetical protein
MVAEIGAQLAAALARRAAFPGSVVAPTVAAVMENDSRAIPKPSQSDMIWLTDASRSGISESESPEIEDHHGCAHTRLAPVDQARTIVSTA